MLVTDAHAQTAEATQAAAKAAEVYLNQGVLGATCVFLIVLLVAALFVIRSLYNEGLASSARERGIIEKLITAVEGARDESAAVREAMRGIREILETRGQAIGDLSHQIDRTTTETRHTLGNMASILDSVSRWLHQGRGQNGGGA